MFVTSRRMALVKKKRKLVKLSKQSKKKQQKTKTKHTNKETELCIPQETAEMLKETSLNKKKMHRGAIQNLIVLLV